MNIQSTSREPAQHHQTEAVAVVQCAGREVRLGTGRRPRVRRFPAADAGIQPESTGDGRPVPEASVAQPDDGVTSTETNRHLYGDEIPKRPTNNTSHRTDVFVYYMAMIYIYINTLRAANITIQNGFILIYIYTTNKTYTIYIQIECICKHQSSLYSKKKKKLQRCPSLSARFFYSNRMWIETVAPYMCEIHLSHTY